MFKRILYDDWTGVIPVISFWLTFGVFIAICIRTLLLRKATVNELEQLPLKEDTTAAKEESST